MSILDHLYTDPYHISFSIFSTGKFELNRRGCLISRSYRSTLPASYGIGMLKDGIAGLAHIGAYDSFAPYISPMVNAFGGPDGLAAIVVGVHPGDVSQLVKMLWDKGVSTQSLVLIPQPGSIDMGVDPRAGEMLVVMAAREYRVKFECGLNKPVIDAIRPKTPSPRHWR